MKDDVKYRNHPNAPHNQPFMGGKPKTKKRHWSNVRGHNNVKKQGEQ